MNKITCDSIQTISFLQQISPPNLTQTFRRSLSHSIIFLSRAVSENRRNYFLFPVRRHRRYRHRTHAINLYSLLFRKVSDWERRDNDFAGIFMFMFNVVHLGCIVFKAIALTRHSLDGEDNSTRHVIKNVVDRLMAHGNDTSDQQPQQQQPSN